MAEHRQPQKKAVEANFYHDPVHGHCVEKKVMGDMGNVVLAKVKSTDAQEYPIEWERYMRAFSTEDRGGTPLATIPGFDPNLAGIFALKGVQNAEDLAALNDRQAQDIVGNGMILRDVAKLMVGAPAKTRIVKADVSEVEALRAQLAKTEAERDEAMRMATEPNNAIVGQFNQPLTDDLDSDDPVKRGPGRPKKVA